MSSCRAAWPRVGRALRGFALGKKYISMRAIFQKRRKHAHTKMVRPMSFDLETEASDEAKGV